MFGQKSKLNKRWAVLSRVLFMEVGSKNKMFYYLTKDFMQSCNVRVFTCLDEFTVITGNVS